MADASEQIQWTPLHAEARENYSHWYKPELNTAAICYILKYRPMCAMDGRMYR